MMMAMGDDNDDNNNDDGDDDNNDDGDGVMLSGATEYDNDDCCNYKLPTKLIHVY